MTDTDFTIVRAYADASKGKYEVVIESDSDLNTERDTKTSAHT
jgi:hypothetical protein